MTVLGANLVTPLCALRCCKYMQINHKKMGPDISIDYTSILHKKLYKNVIVAGTGQKVKSGVKSGACTLYVG